MNKIERGWREIARVVGDTINQKRRELGWSVEKLSKAAKISPAVIYATEAGDKLPRVENIDSMLKALGAVVVLGGFGEPKEKGRIRGFELVSDAPEGTQLPTRKTKGSQGYDFYLPEAVHLEPDEFSETILLGVKAYMPLDEGLELHIRSSVGLLKHVELINKVGLIDADFFNNPENEGNIGIVLHNQSKEPVDFAKGERICQGVFRKYYVADNDNTTGERKGTSGSTGRF